LVDGGAAATESLSNGKATYVIALNVDSTHTVQADYSGSSVYPTSDSAIDTVIVKPAV